MRDEFNSLQLVQLCDGNFLLIHLHNLSCRLSESIDSNLIDYLFIDCSASLARPILLTPDSTDSLLLPAFRSVLQHLLSGDGEGVLHLRGEESGAPLPTLGGWLLEYPVVYYVAGSPGPHHHARQFERRVSFVPAGTLQSAVPTRTPHQIRRIGRSCIVHEAACA
jgi:hypothetical protein